MISNVILNSAVFAPIFLLILVAAYKYDILVQDEQVFSRCEFPDAKFLDDYLDMSNLSLEFITTETVYAHGEVIVKKDAGRKYNPFSIEVYKRSRGTWIYTIYSIRHPDACQALFNPTGIFYKFTKSIEDKTCPFYKGQKFNVNATSENTLELADPRLPGEYKVQTMINFRELKEVLCYNNFVDVYRH